MYYLDFWTSVQHHCLYGQGQSQLDKWVTTSRAMRAWHIADTMTHSLSVTQWPDTLDVFCFITYIFAALHITAYLRVPAWFDSRRRQRCIKGKGTTSGPVSWSSCLPWQSKLMARGQTLAVEIKRAQDKVFYPGWAREDKILLVVSNTNTCVSLSLMCCMPDLQCQ